MAELEPDGQPHPLAARFRKVDDLQELAALQEEAEDSGFTVAGRYQVLSTLGQGGMGAVYKARDTRLDRIVALKTILPQYLSNAEASRRFFREARALARLNHPNILTLFDSGQDGNVHYLVMELGGRDLVRVLEQQGGPLPLEQTLWIALSVCLALEYAHQHGVIHRDLKPANILIGSPGDAGDAGLVGPPASGAPVVQVMDFGLAKVRGASTLTVPQARLGTPHYMSPEQVRGQEADERSDLYALGVLLYELCTGVRPFESDDPQAILYQQLNFSPEPLATFNAGLPSALQGLVLRLLEKDPARRPASASEVRQALESLRLSPGAPSSGGAARGRLGEALPSGTVTFLFTDIEGSTRRWEEHREAMQVALARHDTLVRQAVETNGGMVFKTVGDAFCAAFATAPEALAAAVLAQRLLLAESWGEIGPLRVRMALHTGVAEVRDQDYFGLPVNRVARLLAAGHGGQVLLSQTTYALVRDVLPEGVSLQDLGEHRLKDLQRPEQIFGVLHPVLPAQFPPLRTLDTRPTNLPVQPTPLIGREAEAALVRTQLVRPEIRLLTLTGPGGTGKTRLALQVAADLLDEFEHGVFFIALAAVSDPNLVASTIASTLGVRETGVERQSPAESFGGTAQRGGGERSLPSLLTDHLRDKQLLLLLDNFEQVAEAVPLVAGLLAACPRLKVLVTSRAPLHLRGEQEFPVPPLGLPDVKQLPPVERFSQYAAVALFIERALAVKPDFAVTNQNAPAVAEICARLDGLPLAIELAAARSKLLSPQALLARLDNRLRLLTGGARDLPERQQTLRRAIAWSYDLLDPAEQALFRRLAVFVGGCTLEAAEEVCAGAGGLDLDILEGLASLVDKSLLRQEEQPDGEPRFVMLETIREFGLEQLELTGEVEPLRRASAAYYLGFAEAVEPKLQGQQLGTWLDRLEQEHGNLRAALTWCVDSGEAQQGLRLAGAVSAFWQLRGHLPEGQAWFEALLALPDAAPRTRIRARALRRLVFFQSAQVRRAVNPAPLEESLAICQEIGDTDGVASSFNYLGHIAFFRGDLATARSFYEKWAALARELGQRRDLATALLALGGVIYVQGDTVTAHALLEESLTINRERGDPRGISESLTSLGEVARTEGDYSRAVAAYEEALALSRTVGLKPNEAMILHNLGYAVLHQGDARQAASHFATGLAINRDLAGQRQIALCLAGLAGVAAAKGEHERAARLFGAADSLLTGLGAFISAVDRAEVDHGVATVRSGLETEAFAQAWAEGQTMSLEQAVAYTLEEGNA